MSTATKVDGNQNKLFDIISPALCSEQACNSVFLHHWLRPGPVNLITSPEDTFRKAGTARGSAKVRLGTVECIIRASKVL